jgi:hypothetical protein
MVIRICAIALVVVLAIAIGIVQGKARSKKSIYLGLRNMALLSAGEEAKSSKTGPNEPRAVLMDMALTRRTSTIAAYADGTASIYISNGGGYLGGSESYKSIRDAGFQMISAGHKFQPGMQLTKQFPLPASGEVIFYVVTNSGVYTARAPQMELNQRTHPLTELYAAGQEVITQYRLISKPQNK